VASIKEVAEKPEIFPRKSVSEITGARQRGATRTNSVNVPRIQCHYPIMKKKSSASAQATTKSIASHKLGANRKETANRQRKLDKNFKQSKDVREDRGVRKLKTAPKKAPPAQR